MEEIWKSVNVDIFNEHYEVSNFGNVRRIGSTKNLKLRASKENDYLKVALQLNRKRKEFYVHRLVALTFIDNIDKENLTFVNHIDENKQNNNVSNLEWCDRLYNNNHGTRNKRIKETKNLHRKNDKKVYYNDNDFFNSLKECAEYFGISSALMSYYLNGKVKMPNRLEIYNLRYEK